VHTLQVMSDIAFTMQFETNSAHIMCENRTRVTFSTVVAGDQVCFKKGGLEACFNSKTKCLESKCQDKVSAVQMKRSAGDATKKALG
jgi:hypothetical protein